MNPLKKYLDSIKPNFEKGGKLQAFGSVFEGFESFLFVPNTTSKSGAHIHDAVDSKRIISFVIIALVPALLFGMYNIGYQNALLANGGTLPADACHLSMFLYGFLQMLPKILVSYIVGLAIEFAWAQWKHEEIQEGYLATGILIPMVIPVNCPLWCLALACAFSVIFCKEIFGGTGMNFVNPALAARAFLFFSYPTVMSGDNCWVAKDQVFGLGYQVADATTAATPLGLVVQDPNYSIDTMNAVIGLIPGSMGETSFIAIILGALFLLFTGVASWRIMLSVFAGGALTAWMFYSLDMSPMTWYDQIVLGGFAFGAVFMATDPVTAARTECGKWIYGLLIGFVAVVVRVMNPGYPEGMMLAILLMNVCAPLIDWCVVQRNISRRANRLKK
ncbi:NADH:ubiquinone reductase (Na(+)-transporting) subunit B [Palleniella muris]|uniref:NADH:ubiquinone reductase (Na(+)-transporting) subunit B n=1 Tax=Palleniella muris TaxID=3038145 RepID=A0AC61QSR2_9BACT|nr:NADH:ubiquinone reductase (Na(+)-transporting) subunit B [Palleniella muris]TGX83477.1 NADH:ubiquinone reductase (Na(+)-transporting) subunit B [Palleniella muris]